MLDSSCAAASFSLLSSTECLKKCESSRSALSLFVDLKSPTGILGEVCFPLMLFIVFHILRDGVLLVSVDVNCFQDSLCFFLDICLTMALHLRWCSKFSGVGCFQSRFFAAFLVFTAPGGDSF